MTRREARHGGPVLILAALVASCGEPAPVARTLAGRGAAPSGRAPVAPPEADIAPLEDSELVDPDWAATPEGMEVLEDVLRFQLANNPASPDAADTADFVFLGIGGPDGVEDPPDELIARFRERPNVEPASRGVLDALRPVHHRDLPGRGAAFVVAGLRRVDETTVEVRLRYRGRCTSESLHRFRRGPDGWVEVAGGMLWVS